MANTLAGSLFAYNAISQDYNLSESVQCLKQFCDEVIIVDAGSTDGTSELIKTFQDRKTKVVLCDNEEWEQQKGSQKLAYFQNKAIPYITSEWNFLLQSDEILHERSYQWVRMAMQENEEGFLCKRINLWGTPYFQLNVPHNRKPCSDVVLRLAKTGYESYGDGESINAQCTDKYVEQIVIYHFGFVRKREIHVEKIRHMQEQVFQTTADTKLNGMKIFDPYKWFDKEKDLIPIQEPLPAIMKHWAEERNYKD